MDARLHELLDRWRAVMPPPVTVDELVQRLAREYRAYEIPLYIITEEDYRNDEEVRENLITRLMTITNEDVLDRIYDDEARELQTMPAEEKDRFYWHYLFADDKGLPYRLLLTQHALGQRSSVVLEQEGEFVTGFKVYGHSGPLIDRLTAWVGRPERGGGPVPTYPTMRRGDINDWAFAHYLEALVKAGMI